MRSTDPSPWADDYDPWAEDFEETTAENLARVRREREERDVREYWDHRMWQKYAGRLRADGGLIR